MLEETVAHFLQGHENKNTLDFTIRQNVSNFSFGLLLVLKQFEI